VGKFSGEQLTAVEQRKNIAAATSSWNCLMSSHPQPDSHGDAELEAAVEQAIAACGGDMRATIRALIVANNYLEDEVAELMKAVSHAYTRGRFQTYSG
jgi:hypothetical protein